jgi:RND superfamily putative drug exporter
VFARLGRWCHDRRRIVVALWVLAIVAGGAVLSAVGTKSRSEFTLPDVESRRGIDILDKGFGGRGTGDSGSIVFQAPQGVRAPDVEAAMAPFIDRVARIDGVDAVISPYSPLGANQISTRGADADKIAYASVELDGHTTFEHAHKIGKEIRRITPHVDGVRVYLGGQAFADFEPPSSELLGLSFAIVILILSFGSVLAMGLPVGVALAGIGVGSIIAGLLGHVLSMPDFATTLGVMIGLGVGIDYALFIVTRFREDLHHGRDVRAATIVSIDTAGRAVLFAGTTVVISMLGMLIMGIAFVEGLAIAAAVVVAVTMFASLTLLPALLGFAGSRVEMTRWRGLLAAGLVAFALVGMGLEVQPMLVGLPLAVIVLLASLAVRPLRREVPKRSPKPRRQQAAYKWSRLIQRRPWPAFVAGVALLGVLALPVFALRLGFSDEGNYPKDTATRKAYDLLARGFGPGFNGPLLLATEVPAGTAPSALTGVREAIAGAPGVAEVSPTFPNDADAPTAALWRVIPTTAPQAEATTTLVDRLRHDVLPRAERGTDLDVAVTGSVAIQADFADYLAKRLLVFFAVVLSLSFLLLMVVFRSVLVPLKAVVMNLLSIGAAYGVVGALFQWGWGEPVLHVAGAPVEPFIPMMLFAIVFGLSMDYEVFLLSRVKEEWDRTGDSHLSVADGLAATARVISAAAAIMVFVFGSFLLEHDRVVKLFGTGLATAVLLDATIVRMLLVPATMELLGDRNWWLPGWLDRLLPRIDVEGPMHDLADDTDESGDRPLEPVS